MNACFDSLPPDVQYIIVSSLNMFSLSKLSMTSKKNQELCNDNELWSIHYSHIPYNRKLRLTDKSVHVKDCTWHNCGVGGYPGWRWRHAIILDEETINQCKKVHHYNNLEGPKVNYKNFKKQCAKRWKTYILKLSHNKWDERDERGLEWAKVKMERCKMLQHRASQHYLSEMARKNYYLETVKMFEHV